MQFLRVCKCSLVLWLNSSCLLFCQRVQTHTNVALSPKLLYQSPEEYFHTSWVLISNAEQLRQPKYIKTVSWQNDAQWGVDINSVTQTDSRLNNYIWLIDNNFLFSDVYGGHLLSYAVLYGHRTLWYFCFPRKKRVWSANLFLLKSLGNLPITLVDAIWNPWVIIAVINNLP